MRFRSRQLNDDSLLGSRTKYKVKPISQKASPNRGRGRTCESLAKTAILYFSHLLQLAGRQNSGT
jgi:hypothetical protein